MIIFRTQKQTKPSAKLQNNSKTGTGKTKLKKSNFFFFSSASQTS